MYVAGVSFALTVSLKLLFLREFSKQKLCYRKLLPKVLELYWKYLEDTVRFQSIYLLGLSLLA